MYRVLCIAEITLVVLLFLVLTLPDQDYALREYKEYRRNPSPTTLKAFQDKAQEETSFRLMISIPIGAAVLALAIPIFKIRKKRKNALASEV
jgi:hypothetical protein